MSTPAPPHPRTPAPPHPRTPVPSISGDARFRRTTRKKNTDARINTPRPCTYRVVKSSPLHRSFCFALVGLLSIASGCAGAQAEGASASEVCAELETAFDACGLALDADVCAAMPETAEDLLDATCEDLEGLGGAADNPASGLLDGSNASFQVRLAAFIPCEAIDGPVSMDRYDLFGGDGRGFSADTSASVRASVDIVFGPAHPTVEVYQSVGETLEYDGDVAQLNYSRFDDMNCAELEGTKSIQRRATASRTGSSDYRGMSYQRNPDGSGSLRGTLVIDASNPLTPGLITPPINHDAAIDIAWNSAGQLTRANITGAHDPYPAHEVYLYDANNYWTVLNFWTCGTNGPGDLFCSSANQQRYDWSL